MHANRCLAGGNSIAPCDAFRAPPPTSLLSKRTNQFVDIEMRAETETIRQRPMRDAYGDGTQSPAASLKRGPILDTLEEVKYHGQRAVSGMAMMFATVMGLIVVLGGIAYVVESAQNFVNRHDIKHLEMKTWGSIDIKESLKDEGKNKLAIILYNESDPFHVPFLKAAKQTNLKHEVEFFKLDCEEYGSECDKLEDHKTRTRPDVYFVLKSKEEYSYDDEKPTESWLVDYINANGLAKPESRNELAASLASWADGASSRAPGMIAKRKEEEEARRKKQEEEWKNNPNYGKYMGRHGRYPGMGMDHYGYGDDDWKAKMGKEEGKEEEAEEKPAETGAVEEKPTETTTTTTTTGESN